MNDINRCPNHELLVTYLYDECEAAERESIATHLVLCASCAEEVRGLRDARVHLAAWSPPAMPLGFQLTRAESEPPAKVLYPAGLASRSSESEGLVRRSPMGEGGWWSRPLPAWAQAAAAIVIFAAGMSLGTARSTDTTVENTSADIRPPATAALSTVSRKDFERLEARLRSIESARPELLSLSRSSAARVDEGKLLERMGAVVDVRVVQSERENIQRLAGVGRTLEGFREELSSRLEQIESEQQDMRVALSRRPYQVLASLNGGQ